MDTNDWIKILTDREQRISDTLDQFRTSDEAHLQLVAAKMVPLFDEIVDLSEKLFSHLEPPADQ